MAVLVAAVNSHCVPVVGVTLSKLLIACTEFSEICEGHAKR